MMPWLRKAGGRCGAVLCAAALASGIARAEPTPAGTRIVNVARLTIPDATVDSNATTVAVDEILDVAVAAVAPTIALPAEGVIVPVGFVVTNLGNAAETYRIATRVEGSGVAITGIAADGDSDAAYDPAADPMLADASIALAPGEARRVFVLVSDAVPRARITVVATAATGHGEPGTVFAGAGPAGVDAIVGATRASARAASVFGTGTALPTLEKSQSVAAPDGSAHAVPGAIVTYQLVARFADATAAAEVMDAVPAGTAFVTGSLTLDGQALSDPPDGDAGTFDGTAIRVLLGAVANAGTRTIRFQTMIR